MTGRLNTSRYARRDLVIDDGLLRNKVTSFIDGYNQIPYVDRPDNRRYVTQAFDRLDTLAVAFYGDARLWWVIAEFQPEPIMSPIFIEPGTELIIPSRTYVYQYMSENF